MKSSIIDLPRQHTQKDLFGIQVYQDALIRYIQLTDTPITIALQGEWGSGKSFVMGMLQNEFESHSDKYLVINYDAWKNNFYPDPLIAILYCVLDSIPKQHLAKKDLRLVLRAAKQVARDRIANGVDFFIDELYKTGGWPSVCAFAMEIIKYCASGATDNK